LWDLDQGRSVRVYDTLNQPSNDVFLVPDGRHLVAQTRGVMKIWELENDEALHTFGSGIRRADYSFDGRLALTANADHSLTLWNVGEGQPVVELEGPGGTITSIAISKDGRCAARARDDGTLRIFDLPLPPRLVHVFENHEGPVTGVAFSPDSTGAISASTDGRITNLRPADRDNSGFHPIAQPLSAVAYARDATRFVYATAIPSSKTKVVGLISLRRDRGNREARQFSGPEDVITSAEFSSDGRQVVAGSLDGTVRLWEVQTEIEKRVFRPGVPINCVALSPVARPWLLAGGADSDLWLWDLDDEAAERRLRGHTSHVLSACFTNDGTFAVTGGIDRTVRIWNVESKQVARVLSGHTDRVNSVTVSKDNRLVLSASDDRTVRVWSFDSGNTVAVLRGHVGAVRSVAISPDGLSALSGSDDRTARLWDLTGLADPASAE